MGCENTTTMGCNGRKTNRQYIKLNTLALCTKHKLSLIHYSWYITSCRCSPSLATHYLKRFTNSAKNSNLDATARDVWSQFEPNITIQLVNCAWMNTAKTFLQVFPKKEIWDRKRPAKCRPLDVSKTRNNAIEETTNHFCTPSSSVRCASILLECTPVTCNCRSRQLSRIVT